MSKKIAGEEEAKESVLTKITNFFKGQKGASKPAADDEDEEMSSKSDDEDDSDASASGENETNVEGKKADDSDDEDDDNDEDDDDPDKDDDDDSDEEVDVNGKAVNLKDPKATREAIEELLQTNAQQNELLIEAAAELSKKDAQLAKTTEQVKKEIKSTFTPPSSKRADRISSVNEEKVPEGLMPRPGSIAEAAVRDSLAKKAAAAKKGN